MDGRRDRKDRGSGALPAAAGPGRRGARTGGVALTEAAYAPCQRVGGAVGVVQGALAKGLVEDGGRVVTGGLRLREHGGQCAASGVGQDAFRVLRYRLLEVAGEPVHGPEV